MLIIPSYYCQFQHFQMPVKYRPLHTLLLAPISPYLLLHFKLEGIHFLFHSVPRTSSSVSGGSQSGTSSQTNLQSFVFILAHIWVTGLQFLGYFIPNLHSLTLTAVSKQPLTIETLAYLLRKITWTQKHEII